MGKKIFKTIDEQIDILKGKGLDFTNFNNPGEVLVRENYFFINGYRHLFLTSASSSHFIPGTNFSELYGLFCFDRQLRNILFKNIMIIENNVKSIFSYVISKNHGYKESTYLDTSMFSKDPKKIKQINDLIKKMKRQIRINGGQHSATQHYISNYGYIPLWVLVKVLSFGIVSEFYQILKEDDRKQIADVYNLTVEDMINYLPMLANYRNVCAHEDILYENKTQRTIDNTVYHALLGIRKKDGEYVQGKNDLFALFIILRQMLSTDDMKNLISEMSSLLENLEYNLNTITIDKVLDRMGFPYNWREIANIEKR